MPVLLLHRRHHFMHSMREDRLPECPNCQCCLCISAITSSTRCARTDCQSARVASVACVFPPSLHAFDARGPIARVPELPVLRSEERRVGKEGRRGGGRGERTNNRRTVGQRRAWSSAG